MHNHLHKWVLLTSVLFFYVLLTPSYALATQTEAVVAISSAEEQIILCYQATVNAEIPGANITSLVTVLNDADALLSKARLAYSLNDFDTAHDLAFQSQEKLHNLVSEANLLEEDAIQEQWQDFLINVVGSLAGTLVVLVAGVGIWVLLKKKHAQSGVY